MKKLFVLLALLPSFAFAAAENENDLNSIYQKVIKSNDKQFIETLKKSQRIWLKSRNDSCSLFNDQHGNETDLFNDCITLENESRIKLLNKINSIIN